MPPTETTKAVARMKSVMASRSDSNNDLPLSIDVLALRFERYPVDVVRHVPDEMIDRCKWCPDVPALLAGLDRLVEFRRKVLDAFERSRNPMLARSKVITADPRLSLSYKGLARKDWLP